jgi:ribosomal protein S18 acetylase RimI-like enzyme
LVIALRPFSADDFPIIHGAFVDAFSDYVVKLSPTIEQLRDMVTRRGWTPELSCGAFDGELLVAFTLNAFDGTSAYDSGTGVIPSHRRRGLAAQTMEWSIDALRRAGATRYILEVIETNTKALELYRRSGFEETRRLQCWLYESPRRVNAQTINETNWTKWRSWWDVEPSWQNSIDSIRRTPEPPRIIGDERGYAIVFPSNGDLAQLAVARDARRRGAGRDLLDAASTLAGKPLRIMNVDAANGDITSFLETCGAQRFVAQIEMGVPFRAGEAP